MSIFYETFWKKQSETPMVDFSYKWPAIKALIPKTKGLVILDYGCGHGMILKEMKKINPLAKYIGMDVSQEAIRRAKIKLPENTFYRVADGKEIPLRKASVDFILAADVIEHVFYTRELLLEFARVLKIGGQLLLTTPYHGLIKNLIISLVAFEKVFDPTEAHIRFFTKKSLFNLLNQAGFRIDSYGYFGRFYPISRGLYVLAKKGHES